MTRRDRNILKSMPLDDVCQEAEQGALKSAVCQCPAESRREKWSEVDQKLIEKEKELESLRLDFSRVVAERDEWQTRGLAWPKKKKIRYRSGVGMPTLAQKEMILKFKAGQTSWRTPEPSEDEGDDGETSEISSTESEPKLDHQPEDPSTALEKSPSQTGDSFDEAMEAARTDTQGSSANAKEVASASQPNQEEVQ
ncbi:hypothetical protein FNV43_RR06489 [Rhamnella rubrinervis]|uniref:Uncharacterized protein n=1 Tax=Rhamnella rubrinervis TaxID=2594499 RepID=A0A8K0HE05_9ROSA|nr:hypothetical protein FNV43_RR06489 [Rhamnella rubrinervis]